MGNWEDKAITVEDIGAPISAGKSSWEQNAIPVDSVGTQPTLDEISANAKLDLDVATKTNLPIDEIQRASETLKTKSKKQSTAQLIGNRFSDDLWNSTIGGFVNTVSGRDSSFVQDRAYQLTKQWEKENNVKLTDDWFENQMNDWTLQLMQPPEARESTYLKNEPQLVPFKDIDSVLGPRPLETTGNQWVDTSIDVVTGLTAFITKTKALQSAVPSAPPWVVWEAVNIANGGKPGEVAPIYGTMGLFGAVIPMKGGIMPKLTHGAMTSALFGGTTALAGGSTEEIVINSALPMVLAYAGITRADWDNAKPKSKLQLARAVREASPVLENTSSQKIINSISDALPVKSMKGESQVKIKDEIEGIRKLGKEVGLKPVEVSGKMKVSELALGIEEKAVLAKLVDDIPNLPEHTVANKKAQVRAAVNFTKLEPERARRVAMGEESPPPEILTSAVVIAIENKALRMGDSATVIELATSDMINQVTRHAQEISMLSERNRYSPKGVIQDVVVARKGIPDKKLAKNLTKAQKELDKVETKIVEKDIDTKIAEFAREPDIAKPEVKVAKKIDTSAPKYGKNNKLITKEKYDAIKAEEAKEQTTLPGAQGKGMRKGGAYVPTPKDFARIRDIGLYHLEAMGRNLGEWVRTMKKEFGDWVVPHLAKAWKETNAIFGENETKIASALIKNGVQSGKALDKMSVPIQRLAEGFISKGITKREPLVIAVHEVLVKLDPTITKRQTMDAISGYGKYKRLNPDEIKTELRDLKGQMQQVSKLQDMQEKTAPAKTGVERRIPSDEERQLIQKVNEAKKKGGFEVTDPERQLKTALDTVKTRLKNRIADLELQIETREKIVKTKTDQPSDTETKALTAKRDILKSEFDEIFGRPELTDAQRINMAVKAVEKSITEYERRVKTGDLKPEKKTSKTPTTPELEALRSRRDALKEQVKTLLDAQNPKKTPEEVALQSYKTRLANDAANLNEKIADGDFSKTEKKVAVLDQEATNLKYARDKAKRTVKMAQEIIERNSRISTEEVDTIVNLSQKIEEGQLRVDADPTNKKEHINLGNAILDLYEYQNKLVPAEHTWRSVSLDVAGLPTTIMTSLDFSFPFRQGWGSMATKEFWQGFGQQFKYAWSDANLRNLQAEIHGSPRYALAKKAGLRLTDLKEQLQLREEGMQSTLADKIPIAGRYIRASQRAYTGMANYVRWNRFNNMIDAAKLQGLDVTPGSRLSMDIADVVNICTGSGGLGKSYDKKTGKLITTDKYGNISPVANQLLFSIRKISADVQMANPATYVKLSPFARKMMLRQVAGSVAMTSTILGLAMMAGVEVEMDIRSSDFGKLKFGETRIDISGGKVSMLVALSRVLSGETKLETGKIIPLNEDRPFSPTTASTIGRFARGKLAPNASLFADVFIFHNNYKGDPIETKMDIGNAVAQRFYPMSIADSVALYEDDLYGDVFTNALFDISATLMSQFGHSVQVYQDERDNK